MTTAQFKHGDYTGLAENYSQFRPTYAETVLDAIFGILRKAVREIDFVDVGAGTGIWTRTVWRHGCRSVVAVEPNDDMRKQGVTDSARTTIVWKSGKGEATGLPDASCDLLSMASSFHWVDFDKATREFHRVLRPGGWFVALWNPRYIQDNPLLIDIEDELKRFKPDMRRVSSGRSGLTETLMERLVASPYFDDVVYLEGMHTSLLTPEQYVGAWRSVNDLQVQLGPDLFERFLNYVSRKTATVDVIRATYQTRAWCARSKAARST